MLFGDKKLFAVELDLAEDHGGAWLFGRFCYWINEVQVGDYELVTTLRDVLSGMKWIVYDCGNRKGEDLCELQPREIFFILDKLLYGSEEYETSKNLQTPDTPARFEITIPVDVFNRWKVFLIECGDKARIFFKSIDEDVKVGNLPAGIFDNVIKDVYGYLDKLHEKYQ